MSQLSAHKAFIQHIRNKGLARLISDIINPLVIPPFVLGITIWLLGSTPETISWIVGLAFLFYTLIPLAAAYYLLKRDKITSLDLPERTSRHKLFLFTIGSAGTASLCFQFAVPAMYQLIAILSLVFFINSLIGFLINGVWKMSIHSAAVSSAGAIFLFCAIFNFLPPVSGTEVFSLIILLLLLPLMIWARYRLNVHTLAELLGGALAGFLLTILQLSILIHLW